MTDKEAAAETAAERAVTSSKATKQRSLAELQAGAPPGAAGLFQLAVDGAKNMQAAMAAALVEADEKRAAEAAAAGPKKAKPRGNLRKLYRELDEAIDRDDFDAAAEIKRRIDELK